MKSYLRVIRFKMYICYSLIIDVKEIKKETKFTMTKDP